MLCLHFRTWASKSRTITGRRRETTSNWHQVFEERVFGMSTGLFVMFRRIGGHAIRCAGRRPAARRKTLPERGLSGHSHYNTASSASANASSSVPVSTGASPLGSVTVELDRIAPRFEISASQITILDSPSSFYGTLKVCQFRYVGEM